MGTIPNLFAKDEFLVMTPELTQLAQKENPDFIESSDAVKRFFNARVRKYLHLVLAMSPVGDRLAQRCAAFPSILSGTTMDWFSPWPEAALISVSPLAPRNWHCVLTCVALLPLAPYLQVSHHTLSRMQLEAETSVKSALTLHMGRVHRLITEEAQRYKMATGRNVYHTPKTFLTFLEVNTAAMECMAALNFLLSTPADV